MISFHFLKTNSILDLLTDFTPMLFAISMALFEDQYEEEEFFDFDLFDAPELDGVDIMECTACKSIVAMGYTYLYGMPGITNE